MKALVSGSYSIHQTLALPMLQKIRFTTLECIFRPECNDSVIPKDITPFVHFKRAFSSPTTKIFQMYLENNINS